MQIKRLLTGLLTLATLPLFAAFPYVISPTNTPGDGQLITATGTGGATAWVDAAGTNSGITASTATNIAKAAIASALSAVDSLNIGTLTVTNPPVLDLLNSTNYQGSNVVGTVSAATNATTATNLVAPAIIIWSGPTNSLTLGYPWSKTTYTMTSDISVTNFLGVTAGYPCESVFVLTNSAASNCAIRFPASVAGYGTLITNHTAYVLAGKKAIVSVLSGSATNWGVVQQSQ